MVDIKYRSKWLEIWNELLLKPQLWYQCVFLCTPVVLVRPSQLCLKFPSMEAVSTHLSTSFKSIPKSNRLNHQTAKRLGFSLKPHSLGFKFNSDSDRNSEFDKLVVSASNVDQLGNQSNLSFNPPSSSRPKYVIFHFFD